MAKRLGPVLGAALVVCALAALGGPSPGSSAAPKASAVPVFAYYYIWFNPTSWNRAKRDFPLVGRYSSDERSVMERHVRWAQQAGIDGFIVSWKSTPVLDRRLRMLVDVATRAHFRLTMIYQGLDFHRRPLPAAKVAADLALFARDFAPAPPFALYDKPLVIWSGTWRFTRAQIADVTAPVRRSLLVLATEKGPREYARVASSFDGDAYYWSSADAIRTPGHLRKLQRMGAVVHRHGGIWIAPAAPGFDARLIGGRKSVPRRDGDTLRRALDHAYAASPDLLGIISWNEWTENSYIEPSRRYGRQELRVLADELGARPTVASDLDSSGSGSTGSRYGVAVLAGFAAVVMAGGWLMARRRRPSARGLGTPRDRWAP